MNILSTTHQLSHKCDYYIQLKELEWLWYTQTNIMMLQTENKEQLQTTTLPEEKKAEGGSRRT